MPYSLSFFTPSGLVTIKENGTVEFTQQSQPTTLSPDELATIANFSKCLTQLRNGKFVNYNFNPKALENLGEEVKCEWTESGYLKLRSVAKVRYNFVETIADAINPEKVKGIFTCTRKLFNSLPQKREDKHA